VSWPTANVAIGIPVRNNRFIGCFSVNCFNTSYPKILYIDQALVVAPHLHRDCFPGRAWGDATGLFDQ